EISRMPIRSPSAPSYVSSIGGSSGWPRRPRSLTLHRQRRREIKDLLKGLLLFEPGGFFFRNIVSIGGTIGLGDGRLSRDDTNRWASRDTLGAEERGNRSLVIGLGHGELSV